jgi:hypothetical protein
MLYIQELTMTRTECHAWFNVAIYMTGLIGLAVGWPMFHWAAFWSLAVWGLMPFGLLFYIPWWGPPGPLFDERDREIVRRALQITTHVFWWAAAGGCWLPFLIYGIQGHVPACAVSFYSLGVGLLWILLFSMRIIVLSRRDRHVAA